MKLQKRIEGMEDIMLKYNNLKASLEQLQLNYDAIKKTTKSENIAQFESEFNNMLHDLKVQEDRIQSLEKKLVEKDNDISQMKSELENNKFISESKSNHDQN